MMTRLAISFGAIDGQGVATQLEMLRTGGVKKRSSAQATTMPPQFVAPAAIPSPKPPTPANGTAPPSLGGDGFPTRGATAVTDPTSWMRRPWEQPGLTDEQRDRARAWEAKVRGISVEQLDDRIAQEEANAAESRRQAETEQTVKRGRGRPPKDAAQSSMANAAPQDGSRKTLQIGSDVEIAVRVAKDLAAKFGEIVFDDGGFYYYDRTHWTQIDEVAHRLAIHAYDGAWYTTPAERISVVQLSKSRINSVVNEMRVISARPMFTDVVPGINCASGFIKFDKHGNPTLLAHDREHAQRHMLPGKWEPGVVSKLPEESLLHRLVYGVFKGDSDERT